MKKSILFIISAIVIPITSLILVSAQAGAASGGSGKSGDGSIQHFQL